MNRKNPGLAEEKPITQAEQRQFYFCHAVGWTIAASLFTAYAFWKGIGPTKETALFVWAMAAWAWFAWWYERCKAKGETGVP